VDPVLKIGATFHSSLDLSALTQLGIELGKCKSERSIISRCTLNSNIQYSELGWGGVGEGGFKWKHEKYIEI